MIISGYLRFISNFISKYIYWFIFFRMNSFIVLFYVWFLLKILIIYTYWIKFFCMNFSKSFSYVTFLFSENELFDISIALTFFLVKPSLQPFYRCLFWLQYIYTFRYIFHFEICTYKFFVCKIIKKYFYDLNHLF